MLATADQKSKVEFFTNSIDVSFTRASQEIDTEKYGMKYGMIFVPQKQDREQGYNPGSKPYGPALGLRPCRALPNL
jgi:hypothetical protein